MKLLNTHTHTQMCLFLHTLPRELLGQLSQAAEAVGAQLAQDSGQHFGQLLGLGVARDGERVSRQGRLYLGVVEVDHRAVIFDHVHLWDTIILGQLRYVRQRVTHRRRKWPNK